MEDQEEYIIFSIENNLNGKSEKTKDTTSYEIEQDLVSILKKLQLMHLENLFIKNEVTMEDIKKFSDEDLNIIGVTKYSERKRIKTALKQIQLGSSFYHTSKETEDTSLKQNFNPQTF